MFVESQDANKYSRPMYSCRHGFPWPGNHYRGTPALNHGVTWLLGIGIILYFCFEILTHA